MLITIHWNLLIRLPLCFTDPLSDRNIGQTSPELTVLLLTTLHFSPHRRRLRYLACSALGTDSSCGSPGEGTCVITWHVNQHCMAPIRIHQIPESTKQTGEVVIRGRLCVWSTYLEVLVVVTRFGVRLLADPHQTSRYVISQWYKCSLASSHPLMLQRLPE